MGTEQRPTRKRSSSELLDISESFLQKRDFGNCYKYAHKAQLSNPDQPSASHLLAICAILRNTRTPNRPDWYKILNLNSSDADQSAIEDRFSTLEGLLNPLENTYPFADEALKWVHRAGTVLCDPVRRAHFDNGGGNFWTACPYCRHCFEYEKLYQGKFMKCYNKECRRSYTAVSIGENSTPPKKVLEKGVYRCTGFYPLASDEGSGGYKGMNLNQQAPGPVSGQQHSDPKVNAGAHGEQENTENGVFIEISDNEDDEVKGNEVKDEVKYEDVKNVVAEEANNDESVSTKRRKMMARSTKKVMGRGVPVDMDDFLNRKQIKDESDGSGVKQEGNSDAGVGFIGASSTKANHEGDLTLQFCATDDDIFVGLDGDFWQC